MRETTATRGRDGVSSGHPPVQGSLGRTLLLGALLAAAAPLAAEEPANYTETIPGSKVTFDMVYIKGGTFEMGSPDTEEGRDADEGPVKKVTLEPFWMGKYEVTWEEYEEFWMTEPASPPKEPSDAVARPSPAYEPPDKGWGRVKMPTMHMTYHGVMHYCEWLSLKTGKNYRLPTEAEWEYAARAGSKTRYYFGDDAKDLGDYAWFEGNADGKTHECGTKKPNAFGLYDMLGNVMEYTLRAYTPDYTTDAPFASRNTKAVLRGGSFTDVPKDLRCANRQPVLPKWNERNPQRPVGPWWFTDGYMCGFRVIRPVKDEPRPPLPKKPED
jgi:formylglycine-generating enzyme required for sulfatase activity